MELVKKLVSAGQGKCRGTMEVTLDDDLNVPDRKPDVRQIIAAQGDISTNEVNPSGDKVQVDGVLQVQIFYISDQDGQMQGMAGEIPFREWVHLAEACGGPLLVKWRLEDLDVAIINSRKVSVRAIISAQVTGEEGSTEEIVSSIEEGGRVQVRQQLLPLTQQRMAKKDTYRIKDEYILPSVKPNIAEILYQELSLRGVEIRLLDDKFSLKGEVHMMMFYYGEEGDQVQFLELALPFSGMPECLGCTQEMIPDIDVGILKKDIQVKPDEDGEERILDMEIILELSVRTYGEERIELVEDFYATDRKLEPVAAELELLELAGRNSSQMRLAGRVEVGENAPAILLLCGTSGAVRVDDCSRSEEGIRIEGVLELPILYITSQDNMPVYSVKGMLPFEETIAVDGLLEGDSFEVKPVLDQVALSLMDGREVDVKATVNMDTLIFRRSRQRFVTGCTEEAFYEEELAAMPGLTGYFVQEGDTWWTVSRRYLVPVDKLQEMNDAIQGELEPGMKLLIAKEPMPA